MKIRNGFVSNSSSSSFVIQKHYLSECQMDQIRKHKEFLMVEKKNAKKTNWGRYEHPEYGWVGYENDAWYIKETNSEISGWTTMDNFNMKAYLVEEVGVKPSLIKTEERFWPADDVNCDGSDSLKEEK